jgi:hypothetical protein
MRAAIPAALVAVLLLGSQPGLAQIQPPPPPTQPRLPPPLQPPVLLSLDALQVAGQKYRISGRVAATNPNLCGVVITGAATGVATCDAKGYFDAIFAVATPGQIQAVVSDGISQSGPSVLTLTNAAPSVGNFRAVQGPGNSWTFSGSVTDEAAAGLSVTLAGPAGVNGATATVLADGSWSVTLTLPDGTSGTVSATATDWYGLTGVAYTSFGS